MMNIIHVMKITLLTGIILTIMAIMEVMKLKVKIIARKENYEKYKLNLEKAGFIISEDAGLVFKESDFIQDTFVGLIEDKYEIVHYSKILYFESYGHDIFMKTTNTTYKVKEKLYEIEYLLYDKDFIRINKSTIISKYGIKEIIPTFNSRINLVMKNNDIVYVTRNYSQIFKEFIGF